MHVIVEGRDGDGCHVLGLGDEWKMGCPKSPIWESEGEAWLEDESVSSSGSREGNVCNDALHVIGLYGPGGKISLFLQDWELAKVALSCHIGPGHAVPENARGLGSWVAAAKEPPCHSKKSLSLTVDGLTKRREMWREKKGRRNASDEPF